MNHHYKIRESRNQAGTLLPAGGLAIDLVIIYNFLSSGNLDSLQSASLAALTLALPFLACDTLLRKKVGAIGYNIDSISDHMWIIGELIGFLASGIGILLTFWHMSHLIGITFSVAILPAILIYGQHNKTLEKLEGTLEDTGNSHTPPLQSSIEKLDLTAKNHKDK